MGGIGLIIGGALAGLGDGLHDQAVQNDADRREQEQNALATARATALENLRHTNTMEEKATDYQAQDTLDAHKQARGFAYGTQQKAQEGQIEQQNIKLRGSIDLSNQSVIEGLKHKYNLSEDEVKSALDLKNQLSAAGQTVDHWAVTTDGKMVAFNKQGGVLRYSANPGSFVPSGESQTMDGGSLGGDSISGERASRGGGGAKPAPKPSAAPAKSGDIPGQRGAALAQLGNIYAQISANPAAKAQYQQQYPGMFDANGNLLPKDVLIQQVNQRLGG